MQIFDIVLFDETFMRSKSVVPPSPTDPHRLIMKSLEKLNFLQTVLMAKGYV